MRAAAGHPSNGAVVGELKTCALVYGCLHFLSETRNVTFKDVHQGLSKQMMEGTYSYDQGYTLWNPPPYQHHAPQYNVYQSNGFGYAYYGYEDPPPPYPPSQGNFKNIFQVLLQERKEFWETQRRLEAQLATVTELVTRLVTLSVDSNSNTFHPSNFGDVENLNHKEVHECLEEVEEENVDQEVADEDKELKGMEILQSASPSKLHFEWVNLSDMNLLGPQHYEFKAYNGHLHKLHNNRAKVGVSNLKKHLGPWQSQKKLVDLQRNEWTNQVWDPGKSYKNKHF
ncbi:hypothetical protein PIB30_078666 [Stylosanthes scabra]|uniref:Uncharacterized protein n=1 Tax=Stylosanthes scabra TaxID=79078 RepID=A0ABU6XPI2_9FABA|nr:hypothetical protein [Stylosanthes scabra]